MGSINERLVRVPNAEAWVHKDSVIAMARMGDTTVKGDGDSGHITMINFSIRLIDGKSINFQHHDRQSVSDFLNSIGVTWEA